MPIFEYRCNNCGNIDEHLESANDNTEHVCSKCNSSNIKRVFGSFAASVQNSSSESCSTASSCPTGTCPFARG